MLKGYIINMEELLKVNSIQKVCFHDGPGISTTIFLNGCPLKCPWCANPETSSLVKQYVVNKECKMLNNKCQYKVDCIGKNSSLKCLEENYKKCPIKAIEKIYGLYTISELEKIILEDEFLYENDGGVTFSGGEPLVQSKSLAILMKRLKEKKINIAIESCMHVKKSFLEDVVDYIDLFIIDIKILNSEKVLDILKGKLKLFLDNIQYIFSKNKKAIFRIPLIKPYITNEENLRNIYEFLEKYKPNKVEIFKGHNLAKEKYNKLELNYEDVETISDEEINTIKEKIEQLGIQTDIIKF